MSNQMISTATDRVASLSQSIKHGLAAGQEYVDLLDQLCQTDSASDLLDAMAKLVNLKLSNAFVEFPQHYVPQDYYLLFMGRLLDMHDNHALQIVEDGEHHTLSGKLGDTEVKTAFKFELPKQAGIPGAFFADQTDHEPLFYLDPDDKVLKFSNHALVNYFIVRQLKKVSDIALDAVVKPLMDFAHYLAEDLDFKVDYGILETANKTEFDLANPQLDLTVIDRLFVATTDTDQQLLNLPHNNGAELVLDRGIKLILSFDPADPTHSWFFRVVDPDGEYSFFFVLLHFKLVRDWYLNNREDLHVQSAPLINQTAAAASSTAVVKAVAESGHEPDDLQATVVYQPKEPARVISTVGKNRSQRFDDYDAPDDNADSGKEGDKL